ncbi:MAG: dihydroorotate dehydrogenase (NAD+) catalytic subunit, partial [Chloroflexi bacterium]
MTMTAPASVDMQVDLAPGCKRSLVLRNPVMTASGTFSNGIEFSRVFDLGRLGAIVSKGLTLKPRRGNPTPRVAETPAGMLNSIGFQNVGLRALLRDVCPVWATWDTPVIVNVLGDSVEEFASLARQLDGVPGVDGLEINISCPNLDVGGMEFGQDPAMAAEVTAAVVQSSTLPVIVKLTPNVTDIVPLAVAVEEAGAHALCVANSVLGMAIDVRARRPRTHRPTAGLTGPAIKPIALRLVWETAAAVEIPVIGCGGIASGRDAAEFLLAGACAVQVGTATFRDP